jgi:hypothetical protein
MLTAERIQVGKGGEELTDTEEIVLHQSLNAQQKTELCEENPSFKRPERPIMLVSHEAM